MKLIKINSNNRSSSIDEAIAHLKDGGLVVAKADTSYAILSIPSDKRARLALSKIKTARDSKQYSLFVNSAEYILGLVRDSHKNMVKKLVPGCVTIVIDKNIPALRYIKSATINSIINETGQLTATSANPSGEEPARDLAQLEKYFNDTDTMVLFEGTLKDQLPSTIVDVSSEEIKVLRQGNVRIEI